MVITSAAIWAVTVTGFAWPDIIPLLDRLGLGWQWAERTAGRRIQLYPWANALVQEFGGPIVPGIAAAGNYPVEWEDLARWMMGHPHLVAIARLGGDVSKEARKWRERCCTSTYP